MMKFKNYTYLLVVVAAAIAALAPGCIKNDIPYPRIQANFLSFSAEGETQGPVIDSLSRTVTLTFPENVDIYSVRVNDYALTPGAEIVDDPFGEPIDLSKPLFVTLRLYQDYDWAIKANQDIERYFEVAGQVGTSFIDAPGRRVVVSLPKRASLSEVRVERAKLGPEGSKMMPDLSEGGVVDLNEPLKVFVEAFGRTSTWTIYAEQVTSTVTTEGVDAWTCVAWVRGQAEAGKDNGVEYRLKGSQEWTRLDASEVTATGGSFCGRIIHLDPETTYEARTYSGSDYGETVEFTTGSIIQLPNSDFDSWWLDGKVWNPWPEGGRQYWDTGNKGATTLGQSNSVPTEDTPSGSGWAAKLESKFIGISVVGKLGAGNIFTGKYLRTDGTNGILSFGQEYTSHPTKLRGYLKYNCVDISHSNSTYSNLIGQPDTCIIWMALIDSNEPFEVRTNPKNQHLFDPDASDVIAYGKIQYGETVPEYIPFEFELNYRSTSRTPRYVIIAASASKYGDYFTGGSGSILYVDDFELIYDY